MIAKPQHRFQQFEKIILNSMSAGLPEDAGHAKNALSWLINLAPAADESLKCATLAHDLERSFPPRVCRGEGENHTEYKIRHASRSAEIVEVFLSDCGYTLPEIKIIQDLIRSHESENANIDLKDADLISFFDYNFSFFFARSGPELTKQRLVDNLKNASWRVIQTVGLLHFEEPLHSLYRSALTAIVPKYRFAPASWDEELLFGASRPHELDANITNSSIQNWIDHMDVRGIKRVCCLLEGEEIHKLYGPSLLQDFADHFGKHNVLHAPVKDYNLCSPETLRDKIIPFLKQSQSSHKPTVVHCFGGKGRTGHVLAAWLVFAKQIEPKEALRIVYSLFREPREAVQRGNATESELIDLLKAVA